MGVIEIARTRTVAAGAQELWELVDDPVRMGEWLAFAQAGEHLDGEGAGRRQRLHGKWGRKRSEIDQRVIEHDPPRRLAWRHEAERLDGRPAPRFAAETVFTVVLEPDPAGGTRVTLTSRQTPASALKGVAMRLLARKEVAGRLEESLGRLAAVRPAP